MKIEDRGIAIPPPPPKPIVKPKPVETVKPIISTSGIGERSSQSVSVKYALNGKFDKKPLDAAAQTTNQKFKALQDARVSLEQINKDPTFAANPQSKKLVVQDARDVIKQKQTETRQAVENELRVVAKLNQSGYTLEQSANEIAARSSQDPSAKEIVASAYRTVKQEVAAQTTDKKVSELQEAQKSLEEIKNNPNFAGSSQIKRQVLTEQQEIIKQKKSEASQAIESELRTTAQLTGNKSDFLESKAKEIAARLPQNTVSQDLIVGAKQKVDDEFLSTTQQNQAADAKLTIEKAYQNGGTNEAAKVLREQTAKVSPEVAAKILTDSKPVVDKVISDLSKRANSADGSYNHDFYNIKNQLEFDTVLADLSAATSRAKDAPNGAQIIQEIAKPITEFIKQNGNKRFDEAFGRAIASGDGADLAVEVTSQLQATGKTKEAESILNNVQKGVKDLKKNVNDALKNYGKESADLQWLVQNWGSSMTGEGLKNAVSQYEKDHPDLVKASDSLNRLSGSAVRTLDTLTNVPDRFKSLDNYDDVQGATRELLNDENVRKVITTQPDAVNEFKRLVELDTEGKPNLLDKLNQPELGLIGDVQSFTNDVSELLVKATVSRAIEARLTGDTAQARRIVDNLRNQARLLGVDQSELDKVIHELKFLPNAPPAEVQARLRTLNNELDTGGTFSQHAALGKAFRGAGVLLSLPDTIDSIKNAGENPKAAIKALTDAAGLGSDTAELLSGFVKGGALEGFVKSSAFEVGGKVLGGVGLAFDALSLYGNVKDKDAVGAGLDVASIGGGAALLFGAGVTTLGVGAVVVLAAGAAKYFYGKAKESNAHENETTEKFLRDGGVTNPQVARELRNQDEAGDSTGPIFAQLAGKFGKTAPEFLGYLNTLPANKVKDLVRFAHDLGHDDKGVYPESDINRLKSWMDANGFVVG